MIIPSADVLSNAVGCSLGVAQVWLFPLNDAAHRFGIVTTQRMAHWLGQIAHESSALTHLEENLNYSAERLQAIFPGHFQNREMAEKYARQPSMIASKVYANRMGNGTEESGDGWRFRGRGPIQITGRENYVKCGKALGFKLENCPETLLLPGNGSLSAGWFWDSCGLNDLADADNIEKITRRINGGLNGLDDRIRCWQKAKAALQGSAGGH
jgi:putative chitinase